MGNWLSGAGLWSHLDQWVAAEFPHIFWGARDPGSQRERDTVRERERQTEGERERGRERERERQITITLIKQTVIWNKRRRQKGCIGVVPMERSFRL